MENLIIGPILGLESDKTYTICFLVSKCVSKAQVIIDEKILLAKNISRLPSGNFWRAQVSIAPPKGSAGKIVSYKIRLDGEDSLNSHGIASWKFYVPGLEETPKIAYTSCNGVSKVDLITSMDDPFQLWRKMSEVNEDQPFSLLIMGGDQLYADSIWNKIEALESWASLTKGEQTASNINQETAYKIDHFYDQLYIQRWNEKYMSHMLASVPSIMMWDDHDIFDGWGSYPKELQQCPVFLEIFSYAKKYFELYQIRSRKNKTLLSKDGNHYAFCLNFREFTLLGLDNRSEREVTRVMSDEQWAQVIDCLQCIKEGTLLVMSAVPVVYRDFSLTETAYDITPWSESLTDDLKDHWRAREHEGERNRLIMRLLDNARERQSNGPTKTIILSGDVHVGCLGVITDRRDQEIVKIHQVVSSGIVHPAPSLIAWLGIRAVTNDEPEYINEERSIESSMLKPVGAKKYIRARNFVTLREGTDRKIWVNWIVESESLESGEKPAYPIS
ncbi:PhoD-like phosphatase [Modicisalibacter xianhensis]|uniref:PhoD-like phosphatase n=1 Tax=Modicisalibacter xianhensis TaxID=442341 RepID=A0A4R8FDC4_9GAMM|nr:alkaline phosphatase D family protein [Halomonas xianhensis]TDX23830.1 PhoD-like phosphatase [Halomonas xianhensis]